MPGPYDHELRMTDQEMSQSPGDADDSKPVKATAEELLGALDGWPESMTLEIGDDIFSVAEIVALAKSVAE